MCAVLCSALWFADLSDGVPVTGRQVCRVQDLAPANTTFAECPDLALRKRFFLIFFFILHAYMIF